MTNNIFAKNKIEYQVLEGTIGKENKQNSDNQPRLLKQSSADKLMPRAGR